MERRKNKKYLGQTILLVLIMAAVLTMLAAVLTDFSNGVTDFGNGTPQVYAQEKAGGYGSIIIDGYFDDWMDKPHSYVINYVSNQPKNQKNYHYASLFWDGEFVFLHIKMLNGWKYSFNGNEYYFQINDRYRLNVNILDANGRSFPNGNAPLGIQKVYVKYKNDGSIYDNREVTGSEAFLFTGGSGEQDEFEMKLPLAAFRVKNPGLDLDTVCKIEMWSPNLIVRQLALTSAGTPTGPVVLYALAWAVGLAVLHRAKLKFWKFLWGSVGMSILLMAFTESILTVSLSRYVSSAAGLLGEWTGTYSSYFEYGILLIESRLSSISLAVDYECSGVIEILVFLSLLWFFPVYRTSEKLIVSIGGVLWIFAANVLRIHVICILIYIYGNDIFYLAHTVIGRLVFYGLSVVLYFYVFTRSQIIRQKVGGFHYEYR